MLDMTHIREHAELLQHTADRKGIAVSIRELDAAREDRITFGLNDLPAEVRMTCYRI